MWMWPLGTWCSGDHADAGLKVGLNDLKGTVNLRDSMINEQVPPHLLKFTPEMSSTVRVRYPA